MGNLQSIGKNNVGPDCHTEEKINPVYANVKCEKCQKVNNTIMVDKISNYLIKDKTSGHLSYVIIKHILCVPCYSRLQKYIKIDKSNENLQRDMIKCYEILASYDEDYETVGSQIKIRYLSAEEWRDKVEAREIEELMNPYSRFSHIGMNTDTEF